MTCSSCHPSTENSVWRPPTRSVGVTQTTANALHPVVSSETAAAWADPRPHPAAPVSAFNLDIGHARLRLNLRVRPFDIHHPVSLGRLGTYDYVAAEVRRHLYNRSPLRVTSDVEIRDNAIALPLRSLLVFHNISVDGPYWHNFDPNYFGINRLGQPYLEENVFNVFGEPSTTVLDHSLASLITRPNDQPVINTTRLIGWFLEQVNGPSTAENPLDGNYFTLADHNRVIENYFDLIQSGEIILDIDELRNFTWPGIFDLGPSRLRVRAHLEDDRRIGIHIHPQLNFDQTSYPQNVQLEEGWFYEGDPSSTAPTQLRYTPSNPLANPPLSSSNLIAPENRTICPGIHIYVRPGCPAIEVQLNQHVNFKVQHPSLGELEVSGQLLAQSEWLKSPDGQFHMVAGRNRFELRNLEIRNSTRNITLRNISLELSDVIPDFSLAAPTAETHPFRVRCSVNLNANTQLQLEMSSLIPTENGTYELKKNGLILQNFNNEGINLWLTRGNNRQTLVRNGRISAHYSLPEDESLQLELTLTALFGGYDGFSLSQPRIEFNLNARETQAGVYEILLSHLLLSASRLTAFGRSIPNPLTVNYTAATDRGRETRTAIGIDTAQHQVSVERLHLPFAVQFPLPPGVDLTTPQGREYGIGIYGAIRAPHATFDWETYEERGRFGIYGYPRNRISPLPPNRGDIYFIDASGNRVGEHLLSGAYWYCSQLSGIQAREHYFSNADCRANVYVNLRRVLGQGPEAFQAWMHHHHMPYLWDGFRRIQDRYYQLNAQEMGNRFGTAQEVIDGAAGYDWEHPQMLGPDGNTRVETPPEVLRRLYPQVYRRLLEGGAR